MNGLIDKPTRMLPTWIFFFAFTSNSVELYENTVTSLHRDLPLLPTPIESFSNSIWTVVDHTLLWPQLRVAVMSFRPLCSQISLYCDSGFICAPKGDR